MNKRETKDDEGFGSLIILGPSQTRFLIVSGEAVSSKLYEVGVIAFLRGKTRYQNVGLTYSAVRPLRAFKPHSESTPDEPS